MKLTGALGRICALLSIFRVPSPSLALQADRQAGGASTIDPAPAFIHQTHSSKPMARRASSSLNPGVLIGAAGAIVVAIFAGKSLLGKKSASFGDTKPLDIGELLENGNSLRGNEYVVEGQVDEKLQWTSDKGQLVSVRVNTPSGDEFVGVEIPAEFNKLNIDTKQKYSFRVKFRQGGIAVATGVNRL